MMDNDLSSSGKDHHLDSTSRSNENHITSIDDKCIPSSSKIDVGQSLFNNNRTDNQCIEKEKLFSNEIFKSDSIESADGEEFQQFHPILPSNVYPFQFDYCKNLRKCKKRKHFIGYKDNAEVDVLLKISSIKKNLGNDYQRYKAIILDWFCGHLSHDDYIHRLRELLNDENLLLHNQLMISLVHKSINVNEELSLFVEIESTFYDSDIATTYETLSDNDEWRPERDAYPYEWWNKGALEMLHENSISINNSEDEGDILMNKRKRKRKLILNDDELNVGDDSEDQLKPKQCEEDESLFKMSRKRKRIILSDDEDDGLTNESKSNNINNDKVITVKSNTLLQSILDKSCPNDNDSILGTKQQSFGDWNVAKENQPSNIANSLLEQCLTNQLTREYKMIPSNQHISSNIVKCDKNFTNSSNKNQLSLNNTIDCSSMMNGNNALASNSTTIINDIEKNDILEIGFRRSLFIPTTDEEDESYLANVLSINFGKWTDKWKYFCHQHISLPETFKLSFRIAEIVSNEGLRQIDKDVTQLCLVALRNFMKNLISELISFRSSFSVFRNQIRYDFGKGSKNSNDQDHYATTTLVENNFNKSDGEKIIQSNRLYARRNELEFNTKENVQNEHCRLYRHLSTLWMNERNRKLSICSLQHLYGLLNNNRSIIPVHLVWTKALHRTICAFNNIID